MKAFSYDTELLNLFSAYEKKNDFTIKEHEYITKIFIWLWLSYSTITEHISRFVVAETGHPVLLQQFILKITTRREVEVDIAGIR
jgi:hypothetical protein